MVDSPPNSYESKTEAVQDWGDYVRVWMDAINRSSDEEKDWREDQAEIATKAYRGEKESKSRDFNIFHSNIETLVPALYNSTPVPDVRRRFGDADQAAKQVSDIFERALSFSTDAYDFDSLMNTVTKDMAIVDRGLARVRYVPYFTEESDPQTGQPNEVIAYEEAFCEHTHWRDFRRGPGRAWSEVPWIAFRLFLSKAELEKLVQPEPGKDPEIDVSEIPLNYTSLSGKDIESPTGGNKDSGGIFKRALVWEVWDKEERKVSFICPDHAERPLKVQPDPLELEQFFPIPRPAMAIEVPGSLVPVTPLSIYAHLVDELNDITIRIRKLIAQLRPRGGYAGAVADLEKISAAGDGELVPITNVELFAQNGGLDNAITWFPLDATTKALKELYVQREIIKQTIYEVTGIADILRGATDPNETLGAQQLKAQWGSLRIQHQQKEIARFARDLLRLKAEIIANKFSPKTIGLMTGIEVTPEIEQLLKSDILRSYRVDIESDSTIRADLVRNQQTMSEFVNVTAQYASAMGPILQMNPEVMPAAIELYAAFARQFNLGKSAEDALDKLIQMAAQPQQPKPDPAMAEVQGKLEIEKQRLQVDGQMKQMQLQLETAESGARIEMEKQKLGAEIQLKREKIAGDHQVNKEKAKMQAQAKPAGKGTNGASQPAPAMPDISGALEETGTIIAQAVQVLAKSAEGLTKAANTMAEAAKLAAAPKEIVRDPQTNLAIGTRPMMTN